MYIYHNNEIHEFTLTEAQHYIAHFSEQPISLSAIHQIANHPQQPRLIRKQFLTQNTPFKSLQDANHTLQQLATKGMPQKNNKTNHRYISLSKDGTYRITYKGIRRTAPNLGIALNILAQVKVAHLEAKDKPEELANIALARRLGGGDTPQTLATFRPTKAEPIYARKLSDIVPSHVDHHNTTQYAFNGVIATQDRSQTPYTYTFDVEPVKRGDTNPETTQYYFKLAGSNGKPNYFPVALYILMIETGCSHLAKYKFKDGNRDNYYPSNLELVKDVTKPKMCNSINILGEVINVKELTIRMLEFLYTQRTGQYRVIAKSKFGIEMKVNFRTAVFKRALARVPEESWFKIGKHYIEIFR